MNRDSHERRMVQIRSQQDRLGVHEFAFTSYDDQVWDALRPTWMLTVEEQLTWRAAVPIVCFMFVRMHHVDRVKRQLGGEQQIPKDPVNLDGGRTSTSRRAMHNGMTTGEAVLRRSGRSRSPPRSIRQCLRGSTSASAEPRETQLFMDPSMDFIATVSESQFGQVAGRYQRARAAAAAVEYLAPVRPPPPSHGEDLSWIPPITPPSHGFTSSAPAFHPWGTPPSWEYPVSHSGSGGSQHQSASLQQPPTVIRPQPRRTQRQRQAPACGTSSHLQPLHQHQ
ncbi:hypothetical protein PIB30_005953 [Stylosanthes scabra]|uniref:Uncharacterized protein n=1 Tax=Stylosanthes scabra TaxID=79078 RepID=A0ABU6S4C6_9FABA|nr:hypothetical protein [Stylosanthes scabra]